MAHVKRFKCNRCKKKFRSKKGLKAHNRRAIKSTIVFIKDAIESIEEAIK